MEPKFKKNFIQDNVTSRAHIKDLFPINYCYDYLAQDNDYLKLPTLEVNDYFHDQTFLKLSALKGVDGQVVNGRTDHGIDFDPISAKLPWRCGILACRQNKYWRESLDTIKSLLDAFAASDWTGMMSKSGKTLAEIAQMEIASNHEEGWAKYPIYIFPDADEQHARLLAFTNVLTFVLDDFWESHEIKSFSAIQNVIVSRLRGTSHPDGPKNAIEALIDDAMAETLEIDSKNGTNGGQEMIELLVRFFTRPPPADKYNSMEEYLRYRHEDAAVPWILACTKFSINSSVELDSPRLARYIHLLKDHVSLANDIGSYEKEQKAYDAGETVYLINAVEVAKQLLGLPTSAAAMAVTQAIQYETECQLDKEIQKLIQEDELTAEEWRFLDATLHLMTGNVMCSVVMSRYGKESTRLQL